MDLVNFIKNLFCEHKSNTDKDDLKNEYYGRFRKNQTGKIRTS